MAVWFRRIAEGEVEPTRVTLRVLAGEAGAILGRVSTLAYGDSGAVEMMTTEGTDPPIETAIRLAAEMAEFKEQDVDFVDPDGLWRAEWGREG